MNKNQKGFTLIELLIGITILVMIITSVYASYRIGMKTYKKIEQESYLNQNMRQAWRLISRDLRCSFISDSNKNIKFVGEHIKDGDLETDKITFTTYLPTIETKSGGLAEVSYYINNDSKDSCEGLVRENSGIIQTISPLAKSFMLRYFDGKEWKETWGIDDSKQMNAQSNTLPLAVEIQVKVVDENNSEKTVSTSVSIMSN